MSEYYDTEELDLWYLGGQGTGDYKKKNRPPVNAYTLYYCKDCSHVWEVSWTGSIIRYKHMPTLNLKRVTCKPCKQGHNYTYANTRTEVKKSEKEYINVFNKLTDILPSNKKEESESLTKKLSSIKKRIVMLSKTGSQREVRAGKKPRKKRSTK